MRFGHRVKILSAVWLRHVAPDRSDRMASWASQRRTVEVASVSQMPSMTAWPTRCNSIATATEFTQPHQALQSHRYSPFDTPIGQREPMPAAPPESTKASLHNAWPLALATAGPNSTPSRCASEGRSPSHRRPERRRRHSTDAPAFTADRQFVGASRSTWPASKARRIRATRRPIRWQPRKTPWTAPAGSTSPTPPPGPDPPTN
jgi:hypothetical protein